ncbi:MAG: tRNA 4-thiouridine(8) synthase ThiI [Nitrospina sp.]|nr:tRNA 4-thiouridine(8) synthase ThiI [Nitrospina sp.]|tara:strand:+ start:9099 stop:10289 length:1191 start_codon:yes stop_codon:yes gene_type:complete
MNDDKRTILVRYDEIGLKGRNRKYFEKALLKNIKRALPSDSAIEYRIPRGRILIDLSSEIAEKYGDCLQNIPGIASYSIGVSIDPDFDQMAELGIQWIEPLLIGKDQLNFCVRTRRSEKTFPKTSTEINFEVGSRIMSKLGPKGLNVDIKNSDFTLEIEIGENEILIFHNREPGLCGLPVGSSGNILCMLSGGIDSPVAAYLMACRGCRVHFVFFDNQPFLGRGGYEKVKKLAKIINGYQGRAKLFVVPFQDIQMSIRDHCKEENRIVLYRRMMYRIADKIAKDQEMPGLVTGESLGQVASQTLENLAAVTCVTTMNILRPLIGMNKESIIKLARKIGTYDVSVEPQPDCCSVFMPANPSTRGKIHLLEYDEKKIPLEQLEEEALKNMETMKVDFL